MKIAVQVRSRFPDQCVELLEVSSPGRIEREIGLQTVRRDTKHGEPVLSGPVPETKVDPKYPPELIEQNVQGEVILYAVIRADGSVDGIQLVRGVDAQLDANAKSALAQWKFRPALKNGAPVDLEAIVHIPFKIRDDR